MKKHPMKQLKCIIAVLLIATGCNIPTFGTWNDCDKFCAEKNEFCPKGWKPGEQKRCLPAPEVE